MISITIEDNGEVSLKTTNGIEETEIATTIVVEAMRSLKKPEQDVGSKLILVSYNSKLLAVKEIREKLGLGLKESKDLVDSCVGRTTSVLSEGPKSKMNELFNRLDPSVVQVKVIDD